MKADFSSRNIFSFIFVIVLSLSCMTAGLENADAQERRGFFDVLFGRNKPAPALQQPQGNERQKTKSSPRKKKATRNAGKKQKAPAPVVAKRQLQKSETARRILVVGDFVAGNMADGLTAFYADNPDFVVIKRIEAGSGLVRSDYYDWPIMIDKILKAEQPDIIIVMLGANDRQTLQADGQRFDFGQAGWVEHYQARLKQLTSRLALEPRSWVWFGLPPFQKTHLNAAVIALNSHYETEVVPAGGFFVDIWPGFADDRGNFSFSGYDGKGQPARLRASDGINFTTAGRAKLAFYADEAVRNLLENTMLDQQDIMIQIPAMQAVHTLPHDAGYLPPQPLWNMADSATYLAGKEEDVARLTQTEKSSVRNGGYLSSHQPGRADYFFEN